MTTILTLRASDGSIRGYTSIDTADVDWVSQWHWGITGAYVARRGDVNGSVRAIYLHREILGLVHGDGLEGDHIDLDKLNNRRSNLRITTHPQNGQNHPGWTNATSRYRGVSWSKTMKRWVATVRVRGQRTILGYFESETEAAEAARTGRQQLMTHATN